MATRPGAKRVRVIVLALLFVLMVISLHLASQSARRSGASTSRFSLHGVAAATSGQSETPICTFFLGFNTAKAPFDKPLVRQAFAAAVDRKALVGLLPETGSPAMTFTPPGIAGHVDGFRDGVGIRYDPVQARQWLGDAGHPGGAGLPELEVVYSQGTSDSTLHVAQFLQATWRTELAVKTTVVVMEHGAFLERLLTDPPQAWFHRSCVDDPVAQDASYFLGDVIDYWRHALGDWRNSDYDDLLRRAAAAEDVAVRAELYHQAEEILVEIDAVLLPLYYTGVGIQPTLLFLPLLQSAAPSSPMMGVERPKRELTGQLGENAVTGR